MRSLQRRGRQIQVWGSVVVSLKRIIGGGSKRLHHLDGFLVTCLTLRVVNPNVDVFGCRGSPSKPAVQTTVAEHVKSCRVLVQPHRMMQRRDEHGGAEADVIGVPPMLLAMTSDEASNP